MSDERRYITFPALTSYFALHPTTPSPSSTFPSLSHKLEECSSFRQYKTRTGHVFLGSFLDVFASDDGMACCEVGKLESKGEEARDWVD